jgi:hypothetical protein
MSPFAVNFCGESKRVRNERIKSTLGVSLPPDLSRGPAALADATPTTD